MPDLIRVAGPLPLYYVAIFPDRNAGVAPLTVLFDSLISGGETPFTYLWDFGDGYTSVELKPQHTYVAMGSYVVKLTVTDARGVSAETTYRITVFVHLPQVELALTGLEYTMPTDVRDANYLNIGLSYDVATDTRDALSLSVNITYSVTTSVG